MYRRGLSHEQHNLNWIDSHNSCERKYYSVTIANFNEDRVPKKAEFKEERNEIIIENPSQYCMVLDKFSVPGSEIPIFVMPIQDVREASGDITNIQAAGGAGISRLITTSSNHNLQPSDTVILSGTDTAPSIDGVYDVVAIISATEFTIISPFAYAAGSTGTFEKEQDKDLSIFSVTLEYFGERIQRYVKYIPRVFSPYPSGLSPPNTPDFDDPQWDKVPYYYVFEYSDLLKMVNTAFEEALDYLKASVVGVPADSLPPILTFDPITQLITYNLQDAYYRDTVPAVSKINIYVNTPLNSFLEALPNEFYGYNTSDGTDFRLIVNEYTVFNQDPPQFFPSPPADEYTIQLTQDYKTISRWNDYQDIVFKSDSLPIVYELTRNDQQGDVNFDSIVNSYSPSLAEAGDARSTLQFQNPGEYRKVDLNSTIPLRKFDISIFWKDRENNLYPLFLAFRDVATVKFIFIKK